MVYGLFLIGDVVNTSFYGNRIFHLPVITTYYTIFGNIRALLFFEFSPSLQIKLYKV